MVAEQTAAGRLAPNVAAQAGGVGMTAAGAGSPRSDRWPAAAGRGLVRLTAPTYSANVADDRDDRAHARDVAAAKRDAEAAVRDGLADDQAMSESEVTARAAARADREASLIDRLASAGDRDSAADARDASERSGD